MPIVVIVFALLMYIGSCGTGATRSFGATFNRLFWGGFLLLITVPLMAALMPKW